MTATCFRPAPCIPHHQPSAPVQLPSLNAWHDLAQLGSWFSGLVHARRNRQRDTQALARLSAHQLHDMGAPHWLQQRAAAREAVDGYEHFKVVSRLKY
jgi:uncharacterized protein YjiS (DUF1127 family)